MPLVAVLQGGRERMERGEGEVQYMGDIIKDITAMGPMEMVTVLLGGESNGWLPSSRPSHVGRHSKPDST